MADEHTGTIILCVTVIGIVALGLFLSFWAKWVIAEVPVTPIMSLLDAALDKAEKRSFWTMYKADLQSILDICSLQLQKENMVNKSKVFQSQGDIEEGAPCADAASDCGDENDIEATEFTHVLIPCPGHNISEDIGDSTHKRRREVPIFCAICHGEYEVHDTVSWALNSECTHVFHRKCINRWFLNLIFVQAQTQMESHASEHTPPRMVCPLCRQDFLEIE